MQQRADAELNALVDNFCNLVKAARISDTVRNSQENLQIDVHSARIAQAGEALLGITAELKRDALLSDFGTLNEAVAERTKAFNTQTDKTDTVLQTIGSEAEAALRALEEHYYASAYRPADMTEGAYTCEIMRRLEAVAESAAPLDTPQ
mmetsp:Transcript_18890/g.41386  ORF Transcript_18890/g.41386 Transcript_18890/m.41386 type:complete len:149 (-) Transcript_18890:185-631(-)|eukprot:CAMPEP_0118924296 /NCGR_PEP_ID=MMETSP1169-20130426/2496_1 /TAXON_ID=36882 /ORGANISM="Pyramimonas obovata, Strain CCMP722" /LENGTH=148 /DNA_ID=CAMNT_0006865393 /DNA_START=268 /DNA_END=717 /DNA_ORIENTATION=-